MSDYDDIINLPHYHDPKRPYMSAHDRAGQFAPFKSLDGYHAEIGEAEQEAMRDIWEDIDYTYEEL